jgi:MFS family permease
MADALKVSWALFIGLTLIMLGNGLGSTLVGVRAQVEDFGNTITGFVMAGYFIGFFLGSFIVPKMLARVGHVRVFAALAALASLAILIFPLWIDPWVWTLMRILTGLAYAGLYVVVESWLNDKATNETRGQIMGIYLVISFFGMATGPLLLNLYDPANFELFTLVSVLISLAAVPLLISAARAPDFEAPEAMGPMRLYRISPLGTTGMLVCGASVGMLLGMGPSYAYAMYGTEFTSLFMAAVFIGGFFLTFPIGRLSDRFDRRKVIVAVAGLAALTAAFGLLFAAPEGPAAILPYGHLNREFGWLNEANGLLLVTLMFGGLSLPLYSLCIAYTNDHLKPSQMVAASSTLIMANGAGAMLGPNIAGAVMDTLGTDGFFWGLVVVNLIYFGFGLYRMTVRASAEDQGQFVAMESSMTAVATAALNPEVEWPETEQDADLIDGDDPEMADAGTWDDLPEPEPETETQDEDSRER